MCAEARRDFGSSIHRAIQSALRLAPIPSKEGASIFNSGTLASPKSVVWQWAHRYSRNNSRPRRNRAHRSNSTLAAWFRAENGIGLVFVPISVHVRRKNASPLDGLVNTAFSVLAPFFSAVALLSGDEPPLHSAS